MKTLSKFTILVLSLGLFGAPAFSKSTNMTPEKEKSYQESIRVGCVTDYKAPKGDKAEVCKCVAKNFVLVARGWADTSKKETVLKYISDSFNNKLSQKEIDDDPLFLDDFIFDISDDCLKDPTFTLKK